MPGRRRFILHFRSSHRQVFKDCAVLRRPAGARRVAAADERREARLKFPEFRELLLHLLQVRLGDVPHLDAIAMRLVHQVDQFAHLLDGEAEVTAPADECQTSDSCIVVVPLVAFRARRGRQQPHLLVVPNGGDTAAGLLCGGTDGVG